MFCVTLVDCKLNLEKGLVEATAGPIFLLVDYHSFISHLFFDLRIVDILEITLCKIFVNQSVNCLCYQHCLLFICVSPSLRLDLTVTAGWLHLQAICRPCSSVEIPKHETCFISLYRQKFQESIEELKKIRPEGSTVLHSAFEEVNVALW